MAYDDTNCDIQVSAPISDLVLISAVGREELGRLFEFDLELISSRSDITYSELVGQEVTIALKTHEEGVNRYFSGIATGFEFLGIEAVDTGAPRAYYRLTLRPWLWLFTQTADCRIFQNMTARDIVEEVFREAGMTDFEFVTSGNFQEREYCVQYRETDFNFISRLLEEEGIYYYFKHEAGSHTLILSDDSTAADKCPNYGEIALGPPGVQAGEDDDVLDGWMVRQHMQPSKFASRDYDFKKPNVRLEAQAVQEWSYNYGLGTHEIFDYPGNYLESDVGADYANARIEAQNFEHVTIQAGGPHRGLYPGHIFSLVAHHLMVESHPSVGKSYFVVSVEHVMQNSGGALVNRDDQDALYMCHAVVLPQEDMPTKFRPRQSTPRPYIRGIHSAKVVGPASEEIFCDEYGRVKVQFHWDRYGQEDENSSCWMRVSQVWAGKDWAAMHIPRIGQEVLVSFLEGDPDRPVITGRVYNDEQMPPYTLAGNKTQSGIKSRSTPGGGPDNFNEIRMEDKIGSEELYIQAEKNETILVKNDKSETVGHDETINIGNDRTETVGHDETITVGNSRVDSVVMDETRTVGNNRTRTVAKNETVTVTLTRTHSVGINESINVGGAQEFTVGGMQAFTVGGVQETTVGASRSVSVTGSGSMEIGGGYGLTIGSNFANTVGSDYSINVGGKLNIEAADEIALKCGGAEIIMKSGGDITIKGANLVFKASGKITGKAGATLALKGSSVKEN